MIKDGSPDIIKGDYVLRDFDNGSTSRWFYSETDLFSKDEVLEEVERIINKKL